MRRPGSMPKIRTAVDLFIAAETPGYRYFHIIPLESNITYLIHAYRRVRRAHPT
jgi:hypothetical protein